MVFDRDHTASELLTADHPPPPTAPKLVEEFLRVLGLLDVVIGREEYFIGTQGVICYANTFSTSSTPKTASRPPAAPNALLTC